MDQAFRIIDAINILFTFAPTRHRILLWNKCTPTNFFNQDYTDSGTGDKPYANIIARPGLLSFGYTFNANKNYRFRRGSRKHN